MTQDKNIKNFSKFVHSYNAKKYGIEADEPCNSCATAGYRCYFGPYSKACSGCIFRSNSCRGESSRPESLGKIQSLRDEIRDETKVQVVIDYTDCFPIIAATGMPDYNSGPSKKPSLMDLPEHLRVRVKDITKNASVSGSKFTPVNSDSTAFKGKIPILGTTVTQLKATEAANAPRSTKKKSTNPKSAGFCRKSTKARDNVPVAQKTTTSKAKFQPESSSDDDEDNGNNIRRRRSTSADSNSNTENGDDSESKSSSSKNNSSSSSDSDKSSNTEEFIVNVPATPTTPIHKETPKLTPTRSQPRQFIRSKSVAPNNASGNNYVSDNEITSLKRQLKQANDGKAAAEEKLTKAEMKVVDYKGKYRGMKRKFEAAQEEVMELKRKRAAAIEVMYEGEDVFDFIAETNEQEVD